MRRAEDLLRRVFGVEDFRPGQREAVETLLRGQDLFALFPTGAGKSLCYQLPALVLDGTALVVSPLIALMRDQVAGLREKGIPAVLLDSLQSRDDFEDSLAEIRKGRAKLIYVSPERLQTARFRELMQAAPPALLVVDEAHCAVQWGEEFRPAYGEIARFLALLSPRPAVCAMTATAGAALRRAVIRSVGLRDPRLVRLPLIRENLRYLVLTTSDPDAEALRLCRLHEGERGVVFCRSRRRCEQLADILRRGGASAGFYHAGMSREDRRQTQDAYARGNIRVLAATSAFGMGVDIPDIRWVLQDRLPDSVTDFAQQTGRAGRDGLPADCVLLVDPADLSRLAYDARNARRERLRVPLWRVGQRLRAARKARRETAEREAMLRVALNGRCIPAQLAAFFGGRAAPCGICSACVKRARIGGWTALAPVPDLNGSEENVRRWALDWQRTAVAARLDLAPAQVLSDQGLAFAAVHRKLRPGTFRAEAEGDLRRVLERT